MRCSMIRALDRDQGQTTWHSPRINLSRPDRGALGCGLSAQLPGFLRQCRVHWGSELRSCVKVEVAVLGSPSRTVLMVSVDVKQQ